MKGEAPVEKVTFQNFVDVVESWAWPAFAMLTITFALTLIGSCAYREMDKNYGSGKNSETERLKLYAERNKLRNRDLCNRAGGYIHADGRCLRVVTPEIPAKVEVMVIP